MNRHCEREQQDDTNMGNKSSLRGSEASEAIQAWLENHHPVRLRLPPLQRRGIYSSRLLHCLIYLDSSSLGGVPVGLAVISTPLVCSEDLER